MTAAAVLPAPAADFLTVLCCGPGKRAAKRYTSLASAPEDYDAGAFFGHIAWPVSDLSALANTLEELRAYPQSFVVRGRVKDGLHGHSIMRREHERRNEDGTVEPATIEPCSHHWVAFDADETTTPFDPADPRGSVERWRATLPDGLRSAACVFHFSAKQHQRGMVRGRAWFWSETPITNGEGDLWSRMNRLDPCVFRTVQPIYTADPVFEGCADPLDRKLVRLEGGFARLDLTLEQRANANSPRQVVEEREPGDENGVLYELLFARGLVRRSLTRGKWLVTCPKESEHSAPGGEGTVLWAPSEGQTLGVLHCSHSNAGHDKHKAADWLAFFTAEERAAAEPGRDIAAAVASHAVVLTPAAAAAPPSSAFDGGYPGTVPALPATAAPAPMAPPPLPPGAELPVIIGDLRGSQFWCWSLHHRRYLLPCAKSMLPARVKEAGLYRADDKPKADDLASSATVAEKVVRDFAGTGISWNAADKSIVHGYELPQIPPVFDKHVDAWLKTLAGARYSYLAQWFATCAQSRIRSLAACLVLVGGTGVGKTLIALLAARMWGAPGAVPLSHAIDKFNSTITNCPVVLDDEAARMKKGDVATNDFREMLSSRLRAYEPKGIDKRELHGCQRFVITCNAFSDLRFSDVGALEVVEALADRLLVVQCGPADEVRSALEQLRLPGSDDVDLPRLDRHVAWLVATTQVTMARFLASPGRNDPAAREAVLDGIVQRCPELFDLVRETIERDERDVSRPMFVHGDALWVRGERAGGKLSASDVYGALAPWESAKKRSLVKIAGVTIRARAYDLERLVRELRLLGSAGNGGNAKSPFLPGVAISTSSLDREISATDVTGPFYGHLSALPDPLPGVTGPLSGVTSKVAS